MNFLAIAAVAAVLGTGSYPASTSSVETSFVISQSANAAEGAIVLARHGADDGVTHDLGDDRGGRGKGGKGGKGRGGRDDGPVHA
ncbi:hypothetical protein BH10PSE7_BH10PSE7_28660 [soil metagenome]